MLVINLFGAPSSGKSTTAASLFRDLKCRDIECELVGEYAKDCTYEENKVALSCQPYLFGEQFYRLWRIRNKVDIAICDCPLLLSFVYGELYGSWPKSFYQSALDLHNLFKNLNFYLPLRKKYNPNGRNEGPETAKLIENKIQKTLHELGIPYNKHKDCANSTRILHSALDFLKKPNRIE